MTAFINNHTSNQDLIDRSNQNSVERVLEWSPNKRYCRLNTLLGKGAFKVVHKAMDLEEGYEVAWNVLHIGHDNNKDVRHEIEILKSVRHPNIIAFHDAWVSENRTEFIFVTELMTSGTLREYIRKLNLPNQKIVKRWCRQILKGLAYLHGHHPPIIHRDIKCDNIFINGAHGEIKIGDLGTAENMWLGDKKYTVIGTPEFMAPEMYEEEGYNEKVDLYAFGMCLIEMTTGEYPYSECTNTAQIYKKVCQHIKPESLAKIHDQQVLEVINSCLTRLSAQELLECSFLAVEPDVVILENDPLHTIVTLQVVFKGSDKLSVKFEFNTQEDTAEEVVAEMIEEQVLPERYQQWITNEINRILRDLEKDESDAEKYKHGDGSQPVWRRENDIRSELEKSKLELVNLANKAADIEKKCEMLKHQAMLAEEKERHLLLELEKAKIQSAEESDEGEISDLHKLTTRGSVGGIYPKQLIVCIDYPDDTSIDVFVHDTAKAVNRDPSKAEEWIQKLKNQDIMTVGDLRELLDEDWSGIGLTVFAIRALKNMLQNSHDNSTNNSDTSMQQ
ncbi:kinase-like domain-containing protein [Gilbertella persicaria]|uniref:kinase-like domain-containing protein n=1 Tax=Gilbertella persicaria TaxID=101096 RepID=UPI00221E6EDE|nr:kinase-like domain-containing protein [Gilbertella persicaria]KAI8051386.1 kinase-like domain-containing protein [Gilbertella persicaria]